VIEVSNLHAGYGKVTVVRGVTLQIPQGRIVGLLGANGAGKTTLIRAMSGLATIQDGQIRFAGEIATGAEPEDFVRRGLVQVPQGRMLFAEMTVSENLEMGAYTLSGGSYDSQLARVHALFPILRERANQLSGLMSGGEQQMLAIGRALMSNPRCLILDEPSLGLAPKVFDQIVATIRQIHSDGIPVLIAEQNARKILRLADYCYVLESGRIALEGESSRLAADPGIQKSYLGAA
jgi:branched-chain amino acid transport system ATP-binding protein